MKHLFFSALLALSLSGGPALSAAETKSPPVADAKASAKPALAGSYAGKWKSSTDVSGELRIKLKQADAAAWVAEATFTFEGTEVPTKMKSVQVDGTKVVIVFDWAIDGTPGQSKLTGELAGDTLGGTYQTSSESPSKGTWSVTRG